MSWLRAAVNKAVEVGNRTVKNYADSVIQELIGYKSFRQAVKKLEEASVSCRGPERVHLMRRWLLALKEVDKENNNEENHPSEERNRSPRKQPPVFYHDPDIGGEPMSFLDVFLHSQALEGITISMILEAPNEEEVPLVLELFGLCLMGGREVHNTILSSMQDLAKVFSRYQDEVLANQEELLQFAEAAITGLKINGDLQRTDAEVSELKRQLDQIRAKEEAVGEVSKTGTKEASAPTIEALREALAHIRVCSRLEGLLVKKKATKCGDSPEIHSQKVEKLKTLSESLAASTTKAEKRISEHRLQKEEALKFRVTKTSEVCEIEKEIEAEVSVLEKKRDELEAELKKVNSSLAAVQARLHNVREEKDQFYEANDEIVAHIKTKEDELSRSISACRVEADVISSWINFLEDTWNFQCSYTEAREKEVNDELGRHEAYYVNLVTELLLAYERILMPSIDRIEKYVENLKSLSQRSKKASDRDRDDPHLLNPRRDLEEEYLDYETKILATFSVVEKMREQFNARQRNISGNDDAKVKGLFDNIEKLRVEFESIERPDLEMETPPQEAESPSRERLEGGESLPKTESTETPEAEKGELPGPSTDTSEKKPDHEEEFENLEAEVGKASRDFSQEEVGGWEFDELEKELDSADSAVNSK